jgi:hypothetical protein
MGEGAEVPVWEEVQRLCSVTDLKYKGDDGGRPWVRRLRCQCVVGGGPSVQCD